jgi:signal transduction histidine kinase
MHVVMRGVDGSQRDSSGVIKSVLEQCVALTGLSHAFVAAERWFEGRSTLSIWARYSLGEQGIRLRLSPEMRWALQSAIEFACPVLITSGRRSPAEAYPRVLIATPVLNGGRRRAVLAAIGHIPAPYTTVIRSMRRLARLIDGGELATDPVNPHLADFVRNASARLDILLHELRVPLSAAGLILERFANHPPEEQHTDGAGDLLHAAHLAIQEAQSVVRYFSQMQALNQENLPITPRPLQVGAIIERAIALLPGSRGGLRYQELASLPEVFADPLWLTHILTNLLENAITHTPAPHTTDIAAAPSPDGRKVVLSVTSYTAGDPLTKQEVMRLPSQSYSRRAPSDDLTSKGLGMRLAKRLVTAMHGDMWVESIGSRSTTFRVALPAAAYNEK